MISVHPLYFQSCIKHYCPVCKIRFIYFIVDLLYALFKGFASFIPLPIIVFSFIILTIGIIRFRLLSNTLHLSPYIYKSISLLPVVLTPIIFTALTPYWSVGHSFSWLIFIPLLIYCAHFICLSRTGFLRVVSVLFYLFTYYVLLLSLHLQPHSS